MNHNFTLYIIKLADYYFAVYLAWQQKIHVNPVSIHLGSSLVAQLVKNLPAMLETWVQSMGWEDPLEKRMATHSGILTWRIPWTV